MNEPIDLNALADGELVGEELAVAEQALASSHALTAEYQQIVSLKGALKGRANAYTDEKVWAGVTDRLKEIDSRKRVEGFVGRYAWAMCTAIFALILSAGLMNRYNGRTVEPGDMARMAASMAPFSRNVATAPQDMRAWIRDVSQGAPVQLDTGSLRVVSYSQGVRDEHYVSVFYCLDRLGPITLVAVKGANHVEGSASLERNGSYFFGQVDRANCVSWSDRGFVMTILGERRHEDLVAIAEGVALR